MISNENLFRQYINLKTEQILFVCRILNMTIKHSIQTESVNKKKGVKAGSD